MLRRLLLLNVGFTLAAMALLWAGVDGVALVCAVAGIAIGVWTLTGRR